MDTSKARVGAPLAALVLTCILLPALSSPSRAQSVAQDGKYNGEDNSDTTVYEGHARHNTGIRPWKNKSDVEMKEAVKSELTASPLVDADAIDVSVKKGNVTLKGTVENQRSLDDAIESARDAGARTVISKLKKQDDSDTVVYEGHARHNTGIRPWKNKSDAEMREAVRSELAASPLVDADAIDVSVKKGNVTLKGTVENQRSLDDAIESARDAGARSVISKLKKQNDSVTAVYEGHARYNTGIRPWKNKSDAEMREAVRSELAASPLVDAKAIDVSVKKGNVTLKGTVENQRSLDDAIESARDAGARSVITKLRMQKEE
jgi:osmotically-inducible protein OsmY